MGWGLATIFTSKLRLSILSYIAIPSNFSQIKFLPVIIPCHHLASFLFYSSIFIVKLSDNDVYKYSQLYIAIAIYSYIVADKCMDIFIVAMIIRLILSEAPNS